MKSVAGKPAGSDSEKDMPTAWASTIGAPRWSFFTFTRSHEAEMEAG